MVKRESQVDITINKKYSGLVPEISPEEYEALKQSVKENGLYVHLIVNQNGVLLDSGMDDCISLEVV